MTEFPLPPPLLRDCAHGCLLYGQHAPNCLCTHECPDHASHCEGCLPRPAEIGHYCQRCAFHLRDTIDTIPPLIAHLLALPDGRTTPPDRPNNGDPTRRATKVDQHSPSPAHDTADEAARWLHSWAIDLADTLAERGPFEYRHDGIPNPNPITEARYLTTRLAQLCAHPAINDLTDEARKLKHSLTQAAGTGPADQRIPTPCPSCNQRTLVRPNGAEHVECRNRRCAVVWYSDEYQRLAKVINS